MCARDLQLAADDGRVDELGRLFVDRFLPFKECGPHAHFRSILNLSACKVPRRASLDGSRVVLRLLCSLSRGPTRASTRLIVPLGRARRILHAPDRHCAPGYHRR